MNTYSTNYWHWTTWLVSYLFLLGVLLFGVDKGLNYEKKYSMDLTGYILTLFTLGAVGIVSWELIILFDFLIKGVRGVIRFTDTDMTIDFNGAQETLHFEDIRSVEFVMPRFRTRSITSHISHCKLTFTGKTVFLTSFTIRNEDIAKHLKITMPSVRNRERRYFELLH